MEIHLNHCTLFRFALKKKIKIVFNLIKFLAQISPIKTFPLTTYNKCFVLINA